MIMKDKRAISPIFVFLIILLGLIAVYLILLIPVPAFTKIRTIVNYFLVLMLWFLVQGLVVYGYYRLGKLAVRGFAYYKKGLARVTDRIKSLFEVR